MSAPPPTLNFPSVTRPPNLARRTYIINFHAAPTASDHNAHGITCAAEFVGEAQLGWTGQCSFDICFIAAWLLPLDMALDLDGLVLFQLGSGEDDLREGFGTPQYCSRRASCRCAVHGPLLPFAVPPRLRILSCENCASRSWCDKHNFPRASNGFLICLK